MTGFGDVVKKAFYLGVGVASYAGEKAGVTLKDLRAQTQTIVDELVARGEMTAEEAQRLVNEMVNRAQATPTAAGHDTSASQPRPIEILDEDDDSALTTETDQATRLRQQVAELRQELNTLRQNQARQ
jgi:polyhydroxyalkanoate synthesis regulator phasin